MHSKFPAELITPEVGCLPHLATAPQKIGHSHIHPPHLAGSHRIGSGGEGFSRTSEASPSAARKIPVVSVEISARPVSLFLLIQGASSRCRSVMKGLQHMPAFPGLDPGFGMARNCRQSLLNFLDALEKIFDLLYF